MLASLPVFSLSKAAEFNAIRILARVCLHGISGVGLTSGAVLVARCFAYIRAAECTPELAGMTVNPVITTLPVEAALLVTLYICTSKNENP